MNADSRYFFVSRPSRLVLALSIAVALSLFEFLLVSALEGPPSRWGHLPEQASLTLLCLVVGLLWGGLCASLSKGVASAVVLCLGGGFLAGVLFSAGVIFGVLMMIPGVPLWTDEQIHRLLLGGAICGLLGLLVGVTALVPTIAFVRAKRSRAYDRGDRALVVLGLWLSGFISIGWGCWYGFAVSETPGVLTRENAFVSGVSWGALLLVLLSLVVVGCGLQRLKHRRSWYERVLLGLEPGWTVVPADDIVLESDALRPLFHSSFQSDSVLVREGTEDESSTYRTQGQRLPVAIV